MNFNAIFEWISIVDLPRPGAACHLLMGDVGEAVVASIFAKILPPAKLMLCLLPVLAELIVCLFESDNVKGQSNGDPEFGSGL